MRASAVRPPGEPAERVPFAESESCGCSFAVGFAVSGQTSSVPEIHNGLSAIDLLFVPFAKPGFEITGGNAPVDDLAQRFSMLAQHIDGFVEIQIGHRK